LQVDSAGTAFKTFCKEQEFLMKTDVTRVVSCLIPCLVLCLSQNASAEVVVTISQVGADVVATGSGSFDTAALINDTTIPNVTAFSQSKNPNLDIGSTEDVLRYDDFTNFIPANQTGYGTDAIPINASSGTGDNFGFGEFDLVSPPHPGLIVVPVGYVSGSALSGTSTWDNATFASLGIEAGSYTWTWGNGPTADSFTINAVDSATPEPGTFGLSVVAAALVILGGRKLRSVSAPW
jgi:hypothetical protein